VLIRDGAGREGMRARTRHTMRETVETRRRGGGKGFAVMLERARAHIRRVPAPLNLPRGSGGGGGGGITMREPVE
jgi:hypothetical protein